MQEEPLGLMPCSAESSATITLTVLLFYMWGNLILLIRQPLLPSTKQELLKATEQRNCKLLYSKTSVSLFPI